MPEGLVTMSAKEVDRLAVVARVLERRLSQKAAATVLGVSTRQVRRMCGAVRCDGAAGLVSKRRGGPSNNRLGDDVRGSVVGIVRDRYADFGPTLAAEKLREQHGIHVSRETLRSWMMAAGLWRSRKDRVPQPHQARARRDCLGELVQIDGCQHAWFEERGPVCTLLVYVDDATGRLMELLFVQAESAFDYFEATRSYLQRHGKPVPFYSDKHSVFRVAREGSSGRSQGVTQFGRVLGQLNIDIICANTPQAKGRVERMNRSLQDRLVKELRLRGISTVEDGNAYLPSFIVDYNRRFARAPRNPHDAHRPLRADEDLGKIFTWREERTMSRDLVVHYRRATYLISPTPETRKLVGTKRRVDVIERSDGSVEIQYQGRRLPYTVHDKQRLIAPGEIVENKHLGAALAVAQRYQEERDRARLTSSRVTLRRKARLMSERAAVGLPCEPEPPASRARERPLPSTGIARVDAYLESFIAEQAAKRRRRNAITNEHKRERQIAEALNKATSTQE